MPLLLTNLDVEDLLPPEECLVSMERAYRDLARGEAGYRPRSDLYAPATSQSEAFYRLRTMEGVSAALGVAAIRIGSDVVRWYEDSGNLKQQLVPAASNGRWVGLVLLFDTATSELLLVVPDGVMQRLRVAATTALAARCLARPDSAVLGLLGAGNQARSAVRFLAATFHLREVRVFSPHPERCRAFATETASAVGLNVSACESAADVVRGADIVSCATNSLVPVLHAEWLEPGMHVGAVQWCELEDAVFKRADFTALHFRGSTVHNYVVGVTPGSIAGLHKNDVAEWMQHLPELSDVLMGDGRPSRQAITCFMNNMGFGLQFAALGRRLYDLARSRGVGRDLPLEWFTQDTPS